MSNVAHRFGTFALGAALGVGFAPGIGEAVAQRPIAIRNVRVFDGQRVLTAATVLIDGGRIAAVGSNVAVPSGAELIDGTGKTLLPGLIDSHTHTIVPAVLEAALAFGVTTQLDMFTVATLATQLRSEQAKGQATARADLLSAGTLATAPRGHGTQYGVPIPTISSADEAEAFVQARVAEGSDYIKIIVDDFSVYGRKMPTLDEPTLRALVAAAHKHGKLAVVHVAALASARQAVAAGANGLVHLWSDSIPEDALVANMARRQMFVVPTLTVIESVTGGATGKTLLEDERLAALLGPEERAQLQTSFQAGRGSASFATAKATLAKLSRGGVRILAGTDAPNPGTAHGVSMHRELELLVDAGLTPLQALRAATFSPAQSFRLGDRGLIEPGRRADLVLVDGDPTTEIHATRSIVQVWKAGVPYDRAAFRARVVARLEAAEKERANRPTIAAGTAISDFDAGTATSAFGTGWVQSTDAMMGGKSSATLTVVPGGAGASSHALEVSGVIEGGVPFAWGGAMFFPGRQPMTAVNLSASKGLRFHARGDGQTYRVLLFTRSGGPAPIVRTFVADSEWKEHSFAWSDFRNSDGSDVMGIAIVGGPAAGPYKLLIDTVTLY